MPGDVPQDGIGRVVPLDLALADTSAVLVSIPGAEVHRTGLLLNLVVVRQPSVPPGGPFNWLGAHPTVIAGRELSWDDAPPEFVRLAVLYGDGSVATNLSTVASWASATASLRLLGGGNDGGDRRYAVRYWLSPLPDAAATVEFEWPALGVPRTGSALGCPDLDEALR